MLTHVDAEVDSPLTTAGVWMTVSDIAKEKGVSKQAIAKRIDRLERDGLLVSRPGPRNTKLVSIAEYDRLVQETTDLSKVSRSTTSAPQNLSHAAPDASGHVYTAEQARHMAYKADLARLDLDERLGKLVPVDRLADAASRVAERMVRQIDQLASRADELAAAVARDGVQGARGVLKAMGRDLRTALASEMQKLAAVVTNDASPLDDTATPDQDIDA